MYIAVVWIWRSHTKRAEMKPSLQDPVWLHLLVTVYNCFLCCHSFFTCFGILSEASHLWLLVIPSPAIFILTILLHSVPMDGSTDPTASFDRLLQNPSSTHRSRSPWSCTFMQWRQLLRPVRSESHVCNILFNYNSFERPAWPCICITF